jgi:hypothetical protein
MWSRIELWIGKEGNGWFAEGAFDQIRVQFPVQEKPTQMFHHAKGGRG